MRKAAVLGGVAGLIALWSSFALAQAKNMPPPAPPPVKPGPADFEKARSVMEARDKLRPKAVRPRTKADLERERAGGAPASPK